MSYKIMLRQRLFISLGFSIIGIWSGFRFTDIVFGSKCIIDIIYYLIVMSGCLYVSYNISKLK